jgi:hypothetical protein
VRHLDEMIERKGKPSGPMGSRCLVQQACLRLAGTGEGTVSGR